MVKLISTAGRWVPCLLLAIVLGMLPQGCSSPRAPVTGPGIADQPSPALPAGAIEVGDQLYQVPIGEDEDGCPMYRLHSPTKMVAQVISYRDPTGGFTTDRQEADCATKPD
jgi:hypothetical protein